jgi:hypothetical protein
MIIKDNISYYEAVQIVRQIMNLKELPDKYLEPMVALFDGRSREEHWEDFRKEYDMNDERTKAFLQVCKVFGYLAEGGSFRELFEEFK